MTETTQNDGLEITTEEYLAGLNTVDRANIDNLTKQIQNQARKRNIPDIHMLTVIVPDVYKKYQEYPNEVNLALICPRLSITQEGVSFKGFKEFEDFFRSIITGNDSFKGWSSQSDEPFSQLEGHHSSDGKFTLKPPNGARVIQVQPVRKDKISPDLNQTTKNYTSWPHVILF